MASRLVEVKRSSRISSENQVKLERVHVRMPRHQEPTKDVAKLRKVPVRRKRSHDPGMSEIRKRHEE